MAPAWTQYQEAAAAQFRALRLTADTDQPLQGVRGRHKVDVAVRGNRAGMEFLWIVECKRWKTNVPKHAVATLSTIVQDLGADRGIVLSETGFQPGAVALAKGSNIILTSLAAMRDDTYHEWVEHQCRALTKRSRAVRDAVFFRAEITQHSKTNKSMRLPPGLNSTKAIGRTSIFDYLIEHGVLKDHWPLEVPVVDADGAESKVRTNDFFEFLELADRELAEIEAEVDAWLASLPSTPQ